MVQIKLTGDRERLILGKWTLPGEVVTISDKALPLLFDRLGDEIEVQHDDTGRVDGKTKRRSSGSRRNSKR